MVLETSEIYIQLDKCPRTEQQCGRLLRRYYQPTVNTAMKKLQLEETVYAMKPKTINKQGSLKSGDTIRDQEQAKTSADIQYMGGIILELIIQIGKRM